MSSNPSPVIDTTQLRPGPISRGVGIAVTGLGLGMGVFLACLGASLIWKPGYEQNDKAPQERTTAMPTPVPGPPLVRTEITKSPTRTAEGDYIKRSVTVFATVAHGSGEVTTGWVYDNGVGKKPVRQYCYYDAPAARKTRNRTDIAADGVRLTDINAETVPDLEQALAKCQWNSEKA